MERPGRVLVATVMTDCNQHGLRRWEAGLRSQRTFLMWDVLLAHVYTPPWLNEWASSQPFGPDHRIRLKAPETHAAGQALIWTKFEAWTSYDLLLLVDLEIHLSPTFLQRLHDASAPWATGEAPASGPHAPLSACLFQRSALEQGSEHLMPVAVPGAEWQRITPAPAESARLGGP